jgi:hypothetical protein
VAAVPLLGRRIRAGPPPSTHDESGRRHGPRPETSDSPGAWITRAPPRPRLVASRASHRFRPAASRTPTTRAQGQGLNSPRTGGGGGIASHDSAGGGPRPPPVPVTEETRQALRSWLDRKCGDLPQPYIPRPRRIVVLPRPRSAPDAPSHRGERGARPGHDPTLCACTQRRTRCFLVPGAHTLATGSRGFLGNPEVPSSLTGPAHYQLCWGDQGQRGGVRETDTDEAELTGCRTTLYTEAAIAVRTERDELSGRGQG